MTFRQCITTIFFILGSSQVLADAAGDWRLSVEANSFTADSSVSSQGLGQKGGGLDIATVYYFAPKLGAKLGFGGASIDDNSDFSQPVISNFGDTDTFHSSVDIDHVFTEVFYQAPYSYRSRFGYRAGAGYSAFTAAERSIPACVDCRIDSLNIDSGLYITAGTFFYYSSKGKVGLSAKQYLSGDVNNSFILWWEMLGRS